MIAVTAVLLFLLYVNAPAVAVRVHGAPFALGALVPLLLAVPVAHRVLLRGEPLRLPRALLAAAAMLLLFTLSALLSPQPSESLRAVRDWLIEGLVLALLVVNAVRTRAELHAAATAVVGAGAVMGTIVIAQQLLGATDTNLAGFGQLDAAFQDGAGRVQRRLAGPIGETNRFAQVMAVLIPIAGAYAITAEDRRGRILYGLATLAIAGGMALAYSRGAVVALVLAAPFALAFRLVRLRQLVLAGLVGMAVLVALPKYAERVISIGQVAMQAVGLEPAGMRNADGAARGRLTEMKAAGMLFLDHPVLGAGPGMMPLHYERYAGVVGGKVRAGARRSHNLYLQLAAETGVLGLGAFLAVIGFTWLGLDRARRRYEGLEPRLWGLLCGLELALVIALATSLFLHAAYIRYFWMLLALSLAASAQTPPPILVDLLERLFRQTAARIRAEA